jgi:hypothetical protein
VYFEAPRVEGPSEVHSLFDRSALILAPSMPDLVVGAIARAFHTLETIALVNLGLLFVFVKA